MNQKSSFTYVQQYQATAPAAPPLLQLHTVLDLLNPVDQTMMPWNTKLFWLTFPHSGTKEVCVVLDHLHPIQLKVKRSTFSVLEFTILDRISDI